MDDQARALLIVGALLSGASGSLGYAGGRWSAPAPEIRFVHVPVPSIVAPVDVAPAADPPAAAPLVDHEPAPADPSSPVVTAPAGPDVAAKPLPRPRPKLQAEQPVKKARPAASRQRKPTAEECATMRAVGRTVVKVGGRSRGYSDSQIERALKDCGL